MIHKFYTIVLLLLLSQKGNAQQKDLIGSWRVDINQTLLLMEQGVKLKYDSIPENLKGNGFSAFENRQFHFLQNDSIYIQWTMNEKKFRSAGIWRKNENQTGITITIENRSSSFTYEFVSSTSMILRAVDKRGFFNNIYLRRLN
jgi:hypothetical protein